MNFNEAKIINVYYTKGDRKPYDINGKPIAYIGEEFVGATGATTLRFHFGEDLDSSTATIVTKRGDGEKRLDILTKVGTGATSYYEVTLNEWYGAVKGKAVVIFKAYNGSVTFDDNENPTEITSVSGRIVVSDIFNLDIAYAPVADLVVPPDASEPYEDFFFALSTKLDKADSITVAGALPTLTGDVYDDRYFYVEDEGVGRLYYINGSTAIEVVWQVGTLKLTATGNGELTADTGKISFDEGYGGFEYIQYRDVAGHIGQDIEYYGKAVGAIVKGEAVQFAGVQGNHYLIKKAVPSEINANPKLILGIAKASVSNNEFTYVAHFGRMRNINTSAYAEGDFLWFASGGVVDGALTTTQPTAPNAKVLLAVVVNDANNGTILIRTTIEPKLDELQNVAITSVADGNVLSYDGSKWVNSTRLTTAETDIANIEDGTTIVGKANADKDGNEFDATYLKKASASSTYVPLSSKGVANGVAPLDSNNKIPSIHLPGGVDDIKEFADLASFPATGEASIIYVALDTNVIYRWSGSAYVEISSSLALGETSSTAFAGNRGVALETLTDDIVDGTQTLTDTRITNSATNISPLVVNAIASTTANLQEIKVNNSNVLFIQASGQIRTNAGIGNISSSSNSNITPSSTGTLISRNINDTNVPLIVRKQQGTGNILELQTGTSDKKLEVDVNGWLYQNGTRLFTQPIDNTNTFFGALSGNTSVTNNLNTGFGWGSLTAITSGSANTAVGRTALFTLTSGLSNTSIGASSGRSITTGSTNTFVGIESGYTGAWGTQLATATNSTGIGNQAFTDKSNQMVFGNASVTEFKFDRNASAVLLAPQVGIGVDGITGLPIHKLHVADNLSSTSYVRFQNRWNSSLGDMGIYLQTAASINTVSGVEIIADRTDTDASGSADLVLRTTNGNTMATKMTIKHNGNVGIGTGSPSTVLNLVTQSNTDGIQIRRNSNTSGEYGLLSFRIATSESAVNYAEIRAIRTDRAVAQDTDLVLLTRSNSAVTERMRIRDDGLVGINETSPTAQLQVKSGATNRVPLIVDTLASHTTNLQEWKLNNTEIARLSNNGTFRGSNFGVDSNGSFYNIDGINNARINMTGNGVAIVRNIADSNPALVVNLANASASGNIQVWQKAGTALAYVTAGGRFNSASGIGHDVSINNSFVNTASTGTTISRNVADSNSALKVNLANASATGNIVEFQHAGVTKSFIDKDGNFSGASVIPTYTSLGSRAGSAGDGTITVTDITTFDELVVELVYDGGAEGRSFRVQAPVSTHFQPSGAGDLNGLTVLGVEKGGTTLVSATVSQITNNTTLDIDFGGTVTDYVVNVYGVNY
jgi:hypothetical protein